MKKKILAILLSMVIVLTMVFVLLPGCSSDNPTTPSGTTEPGDTPTSTSPTSAGETYEWRCQHMSTAGSSNWWLYEEVLENIRIATGGRVNIELLPAGAIVGALEIMDAVSSGAIETGISCDCYHQGKDMRFAVHGMVGAQYTWDEMICWFFSEQTKGVQKGRDLFAEFGCYWTPMTFSHTEAEYMSNKPLVFASDYNGLSMRGVGWTGMIIQEPEFGAAGTMIAAGDVYTSLERGVIDACELGNPDSNWSFGLHEVTKYMGFPGCHQLTQTFGLIINMDLWNQLPTDIQKSIELACSDSINRSFAFSVTESALRLKDYEDYGTEFIVEDPSCQAAWRDVSWRLADGIAADDPKFAEFWNEMKDMLDYVRPYLKFQTPDWGD